MTFYIDVVSPFEDSTAGPSIPKSESTNSETNPFRVKNSSGGSSVLSTPVLLDFPPTGPTGTSPGPKSKNPFLDLSIEGDSGAKVAWLKMVQVVIVGADERHCCHYHNSD